MDLIKEHEELEKFHDNELSEDEYYQNVILPYIEDQEYRWGEVREGDKE